ncbi:uncharacterized protein [Nicotiana tomentosiformis]|uniref:uncharacterized protein n=1 Tax=Nicotiana tomentosiformis TaxID=4098 RepID=UPI00388C61C8
MANLSENPSSPPRESTPTPSITPTSKKGRFMMIALKVVVGGEQIKNINEQLNGKKNPKNLMNHSSLLLRGKKLFLLKQSRNWSYGSMGEEFAGRKEEIVKEKRGNGSGEVAEGMEPLEDLLRKVSDSYNPKKKRSSAIKVSGTARANKKRKVASSIPIETPPTRGRATRSQKKQSEAELENALEESKRKVVAKGKKKVVEPVEAVEIEEMDLVLHDEEEAEKMEVVTPKAKKIKTSIKKSFSKINSTGPSTLAKRTRFALKYRKVKIVEEEEEEEEEESDAEKDKMVKFGKRTILKGRLLRNLEEEKMVMLLEKLQLQGWKDMVLQMDGKLARTEIVEFMTNCEINNGRVTSVVKGVTVSFDGKELGEILGVPAAGKFGDNEEELEPKAIHKSEMKPPHKVLFEFINKVVLPRQEMRHITTFIDLVLMECLDSGRKINWPGLIIQHLDRVLTGTKTHAIPYGFILTAVLSHFKVPIKKWEVGTSKDHFGANTLTACDYEVHTIPKELGSSKKVPVNSKVRALVQESGAKDAEIERLKKRLAEVETERDALRTELAKEKEKNDGILYDMLKPLQAKNQELRSFPVLKPS